MDFFETTWKYLASAIIWDITDEKRLEKLEEFDSNYKITQGRKISIIISMASVIEGGLRVYLNLKVTSIRNQRKHFEDILSNYSKYEKELKDRIWSLESIESYHKELEKLNEVYERFGKTAQLSKIDSKTWGGLKTIFKTIHDYEISRSFDRIDKQLAQDVEHVFRLRNFLVHSNLILIQSNKGNEIEYEGRSKKLIKYLIDRNLQVSPKKGEHLFFIEELLPDKLITYLKEVLNKYLEIDEFNQLPNMKNEINCIYR